MVQPLSTTLSKLAVDDLLAKSVELSTRANRGDFQDREVEVRYCEQLTDDWQAAGSWDAVTQPQLAVYASDAKAEFDADTASARATTAHFKAMMMSSFNPQTISARYSPPIVPTFRSMDGISSGIRLPPTGIMEQAPHYGASKTPLGEFDCQRNIFQAAASAVGQVALGAVSNHMKALQAVSMSAEFLLKSVSDIKSAFLSLSARELLALVASQDVVLAQVISVTKRINDVVASMSRTDYAIVHFTLLRREQIRLDQAISKLTVLKTDLLYGQAFDYELWESARQDINATDKEFCGFPELNLSIKPIILVGLYLYLESLLKILARQQAMRDALEANLINFGNAFDQATRFDNLYIPIIDAIKCRLERIVSDMEATLEKNRIIDFLVKEKLWCLELMAISAFMKFAGKARLPDVVNTISGTTALNNAAIAVLDFVKDQINSLEAASVRSVIATGFAFLGLIDAKLKVNLPAPPIIATGEDLIAQCERVASSNGLLGGLLGGFVGTVAAVAAIALSAVDGLLEFAESVNLTSFSDALKIGDIKQAFSVDSFTATIQGQASVISAQLSLLSSNEPVSEKSKATFDLYTTKYREDARSAALLAELSMDFSENHLTDVVEIEMAAAAAAHQDLITAGRELSAQSITNDGFASLISSEVYTKTGPL